MNKKFDKDLKYGQERENRIVSILDKDKTKLEVKTERDWWQKSGNMCIEVECYGKPSGIMATEADYWVHILADGDKDFVRMIFDTSTIKKLTKKYMKNIRSGGDGNKSRFVLVLLSELFLKRYVQICHLIPLYLYL